MRYLIFALAFVTFMSAPDGLDKPITWAYLIGSAAVMIHIIRKEKEHEFV